MSTVMTALEQEEFRLKAELSLIGERKIEAARRKILSCAYCRKVSAIFLWVFVQKHSYVRPYGCTEGDYWNRDEADVCDIICPKCGKANYVYNHPQKENILKLLKTPGLCATNIFHKVEERHDPSS